MKMFKNIFAANLFGTHPKSVRRRFFRDLVALIVFTSGAIFTVWYIQADRAKRLVAEKQIRKVSARALTEFEGIFKPVEATLSIAQKWGRAGILDPLNVPAMNAKFIPILDKVSAVSSILIADSEGVEYFLIKDGGTWTSRSTGLAKDGSRTLWKRWTDSGELLDRWSKKTQYDPRTRPWFQGVLTGSNEDDIFWTPVYRFITLKTFGVTASMRYQSKNDRSKTYVAAFDVPLAGIAKTILDLKPSDNGKIFLFNAEGMILSQKTGTDLLFSEATTPIVVHAMEAWRSVPDAEDQPLEFKSDGRACWGLFRPAVPGNPSVFIGVAVPEADFFGRLQARQTETIFIAMGILAAGILLTFMLVRKYSYQLKDLPVQNLNRLDLEMAVPRLISSGESNTLEFKSTMRTNLKTGKAGKEIELAWLKTVVAYLNTDGGILLIGVDDAGNISGIEIDAFENHDKCRLHFKNLINQHIGLEFSKHLTLDIASIGEKTVVVIECERSGKPVFLKTKKGEDFYIRSGPSSVRLSVSEVLAYLDKRG